MLTRFVKRFYRWRKWHWWRHGEYNRKERRCDFCGREEWFCDRDPRLKNFGKWVVYHTGEGDESCN